MKTLFLFLILFFISVNCVSAEVLYTKNIEVKKLDHNANCEKYCGKGYFFDRKGHKNNGQELVCTKYKFKCGYSCTIGWNIKPLVKGTNYTCQKARQKRGA